MIVTCTLNNGCDRSDDNYGSVFGTYNVICRPISSSDKSSTWWGFFFVKYAQHNIMLLKYVVEMRNWRTPNLKVLNLIQCHTNCKGDLAVRIGRKWTFYTFLYAYQKIQFQYTLDIYRVVSLPKNVCTCRSLSLNNDIPRIPLICVLSIAPILNF